jgi:hypothetical protein
LSKYIKITNEALEVPRLFLELLGVSTKRDNDETIGQFGSGTKFAPIFALRKGWEWISTGFDNEGGYTLSYQVNDDNAHGIDVVQFVYEYPYGERLVKDSSYSLGAGELGWDHAYQVFREAFANALDAHYETGAEYSISTVDSVGEPVFGEFSVYLTADPELVAIVENFDRFFSLNREPVFTDRFGNKLYEKILDDEDGIRVYHKGVLIYGPELVREGRFDEYTSIFDYDLASVDIGEDRKVKDITGTELHTMIKMYARNMYYREGGTEVIVNRMVDERLYTGLDPHGKFVWEFQYPYSFKIYDYEEGVDRDRADTFGKAFVSRAEALYCDDTFKRVGIVCRDSGASEGVCSSLQERGVYPLLVCQSVFNLVESTGGRKNVAAYILGEGFDTEFIQIYGDDREFYDLAYRTTLDYDSRITSYPIKIMEESSKNSSILGKAMNVNRTDKTTFIAINSSLITSRNIQLLISTIIHELDHAITGARDNTREFRDLADNRLGDLIIKHHCDKKELIDIMNKWTDSDDTVDDG